MPDTEVSLSSEAQNRLDFKGDPVHILVGEAAECLFAHSGVLTRSSKFFQAALKEEWSEGQTRTIKLPEDDLDTVNTYLQFLYIGSVTAERYRIGGRHEMSPLELVNLYVFGEKIMHNEFQNHVMDELVPAMKRQGRDCPKAILVKRIYEKKPERSPARKLMLNLWCDYAEGRSIIAEIEELPNDFVILLAAILLSLRRGAEMLGPSDHGTLCGPASKYHKPVEDAAAAGERVGGGR